MVYEILLVVLVYIFIVSRFCLCVDISFLVPGIYRLDRISADIYINRLFIQLALNDIGKCDGLKERLCHFLRLKDFRVVVE